VVSDEQLIETYLKSRKRDVLGELLCRYLAKVRRTVYSMVLDASLADDLAQEVFLRAIRGLAGFDGRAKFSTWLYHVTMNTTHGFLARRTRSPVTFSANPPDHPRAARGSAESAAVEGELDQAIRAALAHLTPKLRAAIVLTNIEQMDPAEAARIEGCSTATMYWRIHEARKQLRRRLERHHLP